MNVRFVPPTVTLRLVLPRMPERLPQSPGAGAPLAPAAVVPPVIAVPAVPLAPLMAAVPAIDAVIVIGLLGAFVPAAGGVTLGPDVPAVVVTIGPVLCPGTPAVTLGEVGIVGSSFCIGGLLEPHADTTNTTAHANTRATPDTQLPIVDSLR